MDERALVNLIERFREFKAAVIAQGAPKDFTISAQDGTPRRIFMEGGFTFVLEGASLEAFMTFRAKWDRKPWDSKWSDDFRDAKVRTAIVDAWSADDDGAAVFTALAVEFDEPVPRYTLWFPLFGVALQVPEIRLGSIRVRGVSSEMIDQWKSVARRIAESALNPESERKAYTDWTDRFLDSLAGSVCLEVEAEGDDGQALIAAEAACEPVVDYLQLVSAIFEVSSKRIRVAFRTVSGVGYRSILAISEDGSHIVPHQKSFGALGQLVLNEQRLARLSEYGFDGVHEMLATAKAERTEIEEFILRSIHWFASGEVQAEVENQLQSYITCIDMFFTAPNSEVTAAVREGFAFVMGDRLEERRALNAFLGEMYDYRSRASHGGERLNIVNKVAQLRHLVLNFIAVMIKRRGDFPDKTALREWLLDQKFGGADAIEQADGS